MKKFDTGSVSVIAIVAALIFLWVWSVAVTMQHDAQREEATSRMAAQNAISATNRMNRTEKLLKFHINSTYTNAHRDASLDLH